MGYFLIVQLILYLSSINSIWRIHIYALNCIIRPVKIVLCQDKNVQFFEVIENRSGMNRIKKMCRIQWKLQSMHKQNWTLDFAKMQAKRMHLCSIHNKSNEAIARSLIAYGNKKKPVQIYRLKEKNCQQNEKSHMYTIPHIHDNHHKKWKI